MNLSPFIQTLRYLKWRQILGQTSRRLLPFRHSPNRTPSTTATPFPGLTNHARSSSEALLPPHQGRNNVERLGAGRFTFLNQTYDLGFPPKWRPQNSVNKLWSYNLHYLDWLHSLPFSTARQVTLDWIQENPPDARQDSWDPYPSSLRGLNWTLYFFVTNSDATLQDAAFTQTLWQSLERQMTYLSQNLETHLLGNHLFENAATLTFVGATLKGPEAEAWKQIGLAELRHEIPEQIKPDGLHFENSPMYHLRIAYLLYLLHSTGDPTLTKLTREPLHQSLQAIRKTVHPDQQIALLNDSAFEIYHPPNILTKAISRALSDTASDPESPKVKSSDFGPWSLSDAGYYGTRDRNGNYIICDVGPIGPDYIPGHAHADFFTYELSLNGCRVIVDAGNFDYIESPERAYCRSTRAHNTVELAQQNQCELWGAFRVGRRGYPEEVQFKIEAGGFQLSASHTGYHHPPLNARHRRTFQVDDAFQIRIHDEISAALPIQMNSYIHLAPQCEITDTGESHAHVRYPNGTFSIRFTGEGRLQTLRTDYFPEFGIRQARHTLCYAMKQTSASFGYSITPKAS